MVGSVAKIIFRREEMLSSLGLCCNMEQVKEKSDYGREIISCNTVKLWARAD
jgi:hypothetical protein